MKAKTVYIAFSDSGEHIRYWTTSPDDAARFAQREGVEVVRFDAGQAAVRQPLTDEQKRAMWRGATIETCTHEQCYLRGVADCEDAHGITSKGGES